MARRRVTRRRFLKSAAAVLAPAIVPASALGAGPLGAPSDRVTLGAIGVGGQGTGVLRAFLGRSQALAVCDPKPERRAAVKAMVEGFYGQHKPSGGYKGCAAYADFRELIARDDIDAVSIATPDHWHVIPAIMAAKAGKDVICEKPLALNVAEGRALADAITRYGRVFQQGTQQRSSGSFRFACELARNERIGRLHTIKVGSPASGASGPLPEQPIPKDFDYGLWLGPARRAPYHEARVRTPIWYFISDYSMGFVSGWGIHHVDIAQWGNGTDLTGPVAIEGVGTFPTEGACDTATAWRVECTYASGVKMIFADNRQEKQGVVFEGDEGWVYVRRGFIDAEPKSLLSEKLGPNDVHLHVSRGGHQQDFINGIKTRGETACPIEVAHRSNSICQLSDIAIRLGRPLRWDPEAEQFINDAEADRMLSRAMRAPWHL